MDFSRLTSSAKQTSALDTYTEQALLQNINSILKEKARTSVFIAHRLRTIYDSDQILVLKDGKVAESGAHTELLGMEGGVYAELWKGMSYEDLLARLHFKIISSRFFLSFLLVSFYFCPTRSRTLC